MKKIINEHFAVFATAFLLNISWEVLHSPLYVTNVVVESYAWALFVMSFRDALLVLFMYWAVCVEAQNTFWMSGAQKHYVLIISLGILISYAIEMKNVYFLQIWDYNQYMPMIPMLNVGLTPVLQLILTPLLTFWIVGHLFHKAKIYK